jgi:cytochrome c
MKKPRVTALVAVCMMVPQGAMAANVESGSALFRQKCQMCHVTAAGQKPTIGPNLRGVVGRKAGSAAFALYSPQLKAWGKVWTAPLLDRWLTSPAGLVPGAKMVVTVPDAKQRIDLIAYLGSLAR